MQRTCIEAMAATQGHTQSLHTNALDEAIALPTDFSARIARNTQLLLQQESGTTGTIDPWAGSYYVERLTHDLAERAWAHIQEAEEHGGMAKAIEEGLPKMRIEEAAARTQARLDSGVQKLIGVNTYRPADEDPLEVLKVDNASVYKQQLAKLERLRAERDAGEVERDPGGTDEVGGGRARPRVARRQPARARGRRRAREGHRRRDLRGAGEGLRPAPGRDPYDLWGVPARVPQGGQPNEAMEKVLAATEKFAEDEGRRPRILVAKMGQDGHDRGQKVIVTAFADMGFDVDVGPLFSTPEEVAQQAVDADVHIVGVNSLAAGHLTLVPALKQALADLGAEDVMIVVGGVIPPDDVPTLLEMGAAAVFPPGTVIAEAALDLLAEAVHPARPLMAAPDVAALVEGVRAGQACVGLAGDHPGRVTTRRSPCRRTRAADRAHRPRRATASASASRGSQAWASRRSSRPSAPSSPGPGQRVGVLAVDPSSVRTGGFGAGRQDPDGEAVGRRPRLHPPLAHRRHPRRRRARDDAGDDRARGRGLRRRARRDRRASASPR